MKKNRLLMYTLLILLVGISVEARDCFVCNSTYLPKSLVILSRNLMNLVQVIVPVIIIITGMIDLLKAVMASDEKKMSEAGPKLIKKIIVGIFIFLVFVIVKVVFSNFLGSSNKSLQCASYFLSGAADDYIPSTSCPSRKDGEIQGSTISGSNKPASWNKVDSCSDVTDINICQNSYDRNNARCVNNPNSGKCQADNVTVDNKPIGNKVANNGCSSLTPDVCNYYVDTHGNKCGIDSNGHCTIKN